MKNNYLGGPRISKQELWEDNKKMLGQLKYCQRVIDEQLAKNIQLEMQLNDLMERASISTETWNKIHSGN